MTIQVITTRKTKIAQPWVLIFIYWIFGCIVGVKMGYFSSMFQHASFTPWHLYAFILTVVCQLHLNTRYSAYGRARNYNGIVTYAVGNGVAETLLFLACYDWGRYASFLSEKQRILFGFAVFYFYSALIHALFWEPIVFPKHIRQYAPPFHTHDLPVLTILSISWLLLYEVYGDILAVCMLHSVQDFLVAYGMAFPSRAEPKTVRF